MAATSATDVNPDETHHFQAVAYYETHFFPPVIGDPDVRDSYSVWGISYLNYNWIEYLFLGKISALLSILLDPLAAARFSNLLLFAWVGIWFIARGRDDIAALFPVSFLLITPQIWYIFGYVNNDGFALVVASLLAYQVASRASVTSAFFRDERASYSNGILLGLLLGLQLICKTNYWPMAAVALTWIIFHSPRTVFLMRKLAFVCVIAFVVLGVRIGIDVGVNGESNFAGVSYIRFVLGDTQAASKLQRYQEEIAEPAYRPSVMDRDLAATDPGVKLREKGVSLVQLFTEWKWHVFSFCSFVGVYGYMNTWGPKFYYGAMGFLFTALMVFLFGSVLRARGKPAFADISLILSGIALTIAASVVVSWTYSFQPQGRYLFPCLPLMAILAISDREFISHQVLRVFIFAMFACSVYSFVFVGLAKL